MTAKDVQGGDRPRYLFLSADRYPPSRADVTVLFSKLAARGHSIEWLLQSDKPLKRDRIETSDGWKVWVGANPGGESGWAKARRLFHGFRHDLKILRLVRRGRYDFVQVKDKGLISVVVLAAARLSGVAFVYWMSYPFPDASVYVARERLTRFRAYHTLRGHLSRWLVYRLVMRHANHVFVQSDQMKSDIAGHGVPVERMSVVPMGVDADVLCLGSGERARKSPTEPLRIAYLGTLSRVRRLDFVLRVFALVRERRPNAELDLVGGASVQDVQFLQSEASRLGIEKHTHFTGELRKTAAVARILLADVCLSPYYPTPILNSTSPTKLIEYMALGKPVVANQHPEQARVLAESGAGLCVPYNEDAFAKAVIQLLDDSHARSEMGKRGREYVLQHRTYDVVANSVDRTYQQIVARCRRCGEA